MASALVSVSSGPGSSTRAEDIIIMFLGNTLYSALAGVLVADIIPSSSGN